MRESGGSVGEIQLYTLDFNEINDFINKEFIGDYE